MGLFINFRPSLFTIHYSFGSLFTIHYSGGHYSLTIIPNPDPINRKQCNIEPEPYISPVGVHV